MPKRNLIWIVAVIAAGLVTFWGTQRNGPQPGPGEPGRMAGVSEAYCLIKDQYYRPIEEDRLCRGAVNGMVSVLDEFSSYVSAERLGAFESRMMGMTRGLGVRLAEVQGKIHLIGPIVNSPAHKAGMVAGDVIVAIDGKEISGMSLGEVEQVLEVEVSTEVKLTIERDQGRQRTLSLTCQEFPIESTEGLYRSPSGQWVHLIEPQELAYVRVKEFVHDTRQQLQDILRRVGGIRGLVLDLRDNPGGMLPAAVEVADLFLRQGVIVTSLSRGRDARRYGAEPEGTLPEFPMVVLINANTASAAEIVAGALRLHDRALLVGTRTRGKGCVQSMFRLSDRLGQINLTTSELLIGEAQHITRLPGSDTWGVDPHPNQEVIIPAGHLEPLHRLRVQVEVLPPPRPSGSATKSAAPARVHPAHEKFMFLDSQLVRAVEMLKEPQRLQEILERAAADRSAKQALATRRAEKPK